MSQISFIFRGVGCQQPEEMLSMSRKANRGVSHSSFRGPAGNLRHESCPGPGGGDCTLGSGERRDGLETANSPGPDLPPGGWAKLGPWENSKGGRGTGRPSLVGKQCMWREGGPTSGLAGGRWLHPRGIRRACGRGRGTL